ncbi:hypothetical protein PILCRDRAFT_334368 [Piloderma croceum F 1598]|uniref:N-acetyltransferase domain-containing protein n=1 Tax=Piloderma croceum (strain F 1598) TaxID=765440 RepID=A0A0C3BIJ9_PILCF|nr:hypothetical protein PILCRDRAFT_334368 [Piloderma croceum F 1598]
MLRRSVAWENLVRTVITLCSLDLSASMSLSTVRQLKYMSPDEVIRASKNLANALKDGQNTTITHECLRSDCRLRKDPLTLAVIGEPSSENSELAVAWLTADIQRALQDGEVYAAGEDADAIAISFGPNNDLGDHPAWTEFFARLSPEASKWWTEYFTVQYSSLTNEAYGAGQQRKSWHIQVLGVRPDAQAKGLGTALVRALQQRAKADNADLYLQTATTPGFYEKLGFEVAGSTVLEAPLTGQFTYWAYRWRANSDS